VVGMHPESSVKEQRKIEKSALNFPISRVRTLVVRWMFKALMRRDRVGIRS
jgi:hypothetical protein